MTCTPCAHSTRSVGWLINNWIVKNKNMESKEPGVGEGPAKVVSVSLPEGTVRLLFGEDISESLLESLANGRVAGKGPECVFKLALVARQFIGRQGVHRVLRLLDGHRFGVHRRLVLTDIWRRGLATHGGRPGVPLSQPHHRQ